MKQKRGLTGLRRKAEKLIQENLISLDQLSQEDIQSLVQELHIHQVELELQNQELREAQLKLQLAHDRYLELYDFAPVGYFTIDQQGLIQQANLTGAAMLGVERKFLHHQPLTRFISQATQDIYYLHHKWLIETQQPQSCEISMLRSDGSQFYAHLESVPVRDELGQIRHYRLSVTDISLHKEAEVALQSAHDELEQRVAERTASLAQVNAELQAEVAERKETEVLLQKRNRELTLLSQSAQAFISSLDLDETLATVLEAIRHLLQVAACRAWLVNPATQELVCRQVNARSNNLVVPKRTLALGEGLAGWVAQHGQSLIVADTQVDVHPFKDVDPQLDAQIRSVLSVPLRIKHRVIGVLQALDTTLNRFTTADLTLLEPLAATAAMAVENARLYQQAQEDAETKATLLREINHRVKNNLAAIIGLLYTKQKSLHIQDPTGYQVVTRELVTQVQGLATVHNLLSASQWTSIRLSDLADQIIHFAVKALSSTGKISVTISPSPVQVTSEQANHLALIINELVTNTIKHALPLSSEKLEIRVAISEHQDKIRFEFQDNGPGYPAELLELGQEYRGIGFELIENIVHKNLRGELSLQNHSGAGLIIEFEDASQPITGDEQG